MNSLAVELAVTLRQEEDEILHAYKDHLGFLTIGVGRLIDERKGGGISLLESRFLLGNDIERVTSGVMRRLPWITTLAQPRVGVLVLMAFQMGVDGLLQFKNTLAFVRAGDYERAANGMLSSLWARQTPERAKRMAEQMRTGNWVRQ